MPMPGPAEVHIWIACQPPNPDPELEKTLSEQERDSLHRKVFAKDRLAYEFAHGVLRDILSRYLDRPPGEIQLGLDRFGKPYVVEDGAPVPPRFNLSHSGEVVLVGVTAERHIGVDVEEVRPLDGFTPIADSHFTPEERAFILRHAAEHRLRAFYRCWTRKEACVKAIGGGLSIPLNSFDTSLPIAHAGPSLPHGAMAGDVASWRLSDIEVPAGYQGAVAVEQGFDRLMRFEWRRRKTGMVL
jgi:4'-phosphopantetheinyl transferase